NYPITCSGADHTTANDGVTYNAAYLNNVPGSLKITQRPLNATAHGVNKLYDGTTAATVTFTDDRLSSDVFTYSYSASFASSGPGMNIAIAVTNAAISGGDSGNYALNVTTFQTSANISPLIDTSSLSMNGAAALNGSTLRLVSNFNTNGSAWLTTPLK